MNNTAILVSTAKARRNELTAEIKTIDMFLAIFDKGAKAKTPSASASEKMKKAWVKRRRNAAKAKAAQAGASLADVA